MKSSKLIKFGVVFLFIYSIFLVFYLHKNYIKDDYMVKQSGNIFERYNNEKLGAGGIIGISNEKDIMHNNSKNEGHQLRIGSISESELSVSELFLNYYEQYAYPQINYVNYTYPYYYYK